MFGIAEFEGEAHVSGFEVGNNERYDDASKLPVQVATVIALSPLAAAVLLSLQLRCGLF